MFKSILYKRRGKSVNIVHCVRRLGITAIFISSGFNLSCFAQQQNPVYQTIPLKISTSETNASETNASETNASEVTAPEAKVIRPYSSMPVTKVTYLGPDSDGYTYKLLELALTKTIEKNGNFLISTSKPMNEARALKSITSKYYENPIRRFESSPETLNHPELRTVRFPVYLGVFSYRTCIVNKKINVDFSEARTPENLKPFAFGLVEGWRDTEILEKNRLFVRRGVSRESVYHLVNTARVDAFCRAVTELPWEEELFESLEHVKENETLALFYLMPFFYSTHVDDTDLADRIYQGLVQAFSDGSLMTLWDQYHDHNLIKNELEGRHIVRLNGLLNENLTEEISPFLFESTHNIATSKKD